MATEIERKFLVTSDAWQALSQDHERLEQGYLCVSEPGASTPVEVRVRSNGVRAWLTSKAGKGLAREEVETQIDVDTARSLLQQCAHGIVVKTRYRVPVEGVVVEIDVYETPRAGLVVAEIELSDAAQPVPELAWLGEDITGQAGWSNRELAAETLVTKPRRRP